MGRQDGHLCRAWIAGPGLLDLAIAFIFARYGGGANCRMGRLGLGLSGAFATPTS